jgi:hypothetical protein
MMDVDAIEDEIDELKRPEASILFLDLVELICKIIAILFSCILTRKVPSNGKVLLSISVAAENEFAKKERHLENDVWKRVGFCTLLGCLRTLILLYKDLASKSKDWSKKE